MVMSWLAGRLSKMTVGWIVFGWLMWAVTLEMLPLPVAVVSVLRCRWRRADGRGVRCSDAGMGSASGSLQARLRRKPCRDPLSRLALCACVMAVVAGMFISVVLPWDDQHLLAHRVALAVMVAACAVFASIAVTARRRRLAAAGLDPVGD